jgi:membrane-associated phospholipid phosphatase
MLRHVTVILGFACATVVGWYASSGLGFGFAWAVVLRVLLVAAPLALGLAELGALGHTATQMFRYRALVMVVIGTILLLFLSPSQIPSPVAVVLIGALIFRVVTSSPKYRQALLFSTLGIIFLFICIPLINCIVLRLAGGRLMDPTLRWTDERLYSFVIGSTTYRGIFPLVKSWPVFLTLESAYLTLAIEPMLVPLVLAERPRQIALFLSTSFICYAVAALVFLVYPVIGPILYFPEAFDARFASTITGEVTALLRTEAISIQSGGPPITGLGYFIALPSMHAAMATVCQFHLRTSPPHYWMMLPINIALVLSTFILGQHYVLDTVAGVILGGFVSIALDRVARRNSAMLAAQPSDIHKTQSLDA